jgi:hypothetical protein
MEEKPAEDLLRLLKDEKLSSLLFKSSTIRAYVNS